MAKIYKKIEEFFYSLSSTQKLIFSLIIVVIFAFIYYTFAKNSYRDGEINYKKFNIDEAIEKSTVVYDRGKISQLDEAVSDVLNVNKKSYIINKHVVTLGDLYKYVLSANYKKSTSYFKFKKLINNFYSKIYLADGSYLDDYIDKVYYYSEGTMYIVKLKGNNDESSYIGINGIDFGKFTIGYIE